MKFWEKFWKLVSKKDLIFVSLIFLVVIILSFVESANKVTVTFGEAAVDIAAPRYTMNVPYEMVEGIELVEIAEAGENVEGRDDMITRTGRWVNEIWGEYYACLDLQTSRCILIHLDDGRIFAFSRRSDEETASIYETFQSYLEIATVPAA